MSDDEHASELDGLKLNDRVRYLGDEDRYLKKNAVGKVIRFTMFAKPNALVQWDKKYWNDITSSPRCWIDIDRLVLVEKK